MNSMLARKLLKTKAKKQNGFTLIELMVVIVIVGILTAVGLPELTKSQNKAKSTAAQALVTNAAKDCSTDLIFGDQPTDLPDGITGSCVVSGQISAAGGGDNWTIALDANGIPGVASKGSSSEASPTIANATDSTSCSAANGNWDGSTCS